jgi:hypothetical protein
VPGEEHGSASLTTIRGARRRSRARQRDVAEDDAVVVAEAAEPVGDRAASSGRAETSPISARLDDEPERCRRAGRAAAARRGRSRLAIVALDLEHREHPLAPTYERVSLSTASAAVRSGSTRNAAYP